MAGEHPVAQDVAIQRPHDQLHADVAPVVGDDLQGVFNLLTLAGGFHHQLHRAAIGQAANAIAVALCQAGFVQELIGQLGVELRPGGAQGGIKERALFQHRHGADKRSGVRCAETMRAS